MNPDRVTTLKVETYQVKVLERAFLIAKLLLGRKRTGAIHLNVSQGALCNVQWEEKENLDRVTVP
jgi:hypothetical protein